MDSGVSPYCGPVVDMVDPYVIKETASRASGTLRRWLHAHPGRWAMFAEGDLGYERKQFAGGGYEVVQRTVNGVRRTYVRLPHPEGEPLQAALARTTSRCEYPADLPDLERDSFEWTKEELEQACQVARENLFPVRATRGRGRK